MFRPSALILLVLATLRPASLAVQTCELNGQHVNPANGNTTAGKTGLMRCREAEGGPLVREEELRNGVFIGAVRYFKHGVLERDYSINERGNRDGLAREYSGQTLVREETYRNGTTVGLAKRWFPKGGALKRASFQNDEGREEAAAEFTSKGQLAELRCGTRALLAPAADDAAWCGFADSAPVTVTLYADNGRPRGRITHERGLRRRIESLGAEGELRELTEIRDTGGFERSFHADGKLRREQQWLLVEQDGGRKSRVVVLDRESHASGVAVRERRWTPVARGGAELQLEQSWYLNGQPRSKLERTAGEGGATLLRRTDYFDNGQPQREGLYSVDVRERGERPTGVHKVFDEQGRLSFESTYDAKGQLVRERAYDATGTVVRDDELLEDGSRKAYSK